jgi:hypothetical protein
MQRDLYLGCVGGLALLWTSGSCLRPVELYCDEDTPCEDRYPDRPFCDLSGEFPASEGIGRTCIPNPFDDDAGGEPTADAGASSDAEPDAAVACLGPSEEPVNENETLGRGNYCCPSSLG